MTAPFKAYWTQVHPVFMIAALQAGLVGSLFYRSFYLPTFLVVALGIFSALYYAHVKDSYIDYYVRHEDQHASLTKRQSKLAMGISLAIFALSMAWLYSILGWPIALLMAGGLVLAYGHAPFLDMHPLSATAGYPTGLALATLAGYYSQAGRLDAHVLAFAFAVWVVLNGVKIVDDMKDYGWDKAYGKRSAPVALGTARAKSVGCALVAAGATMGLALGLAGVLPASTAIPFAFLYPFAWLAMKRNSMRGLYGLMVLLAGVYAFTLAEIAILIIGQV